jgi:hypothetical protein
MSVAAGQLGGAVQGGGSGGPSSAFSLCGTGDVYTAMLHAAQDADGCGGPKGASRNGHLGQ